MGQPFLEGEGIYLRVLEESDIGEDYISWLNDPLVTCYLESAGYFPSTHANLSQWLGKYSDSTQNMAFAIVEKQSGQFIGTTTLNSISWIHRTGVIGIMIGRKDYWGKGYAFEAWNLLVGYAFARLGLRKINSGAAVANAACVGILKKLGFKEEGILREQYYMDGAYCDVVLMGLFRHEYAECSDEVTLDVVPASRLIVGDGNES